MLQFAAQAAHELLPPDVMEPVLSAVVNNFVTERNSAEVMAVGLNAIREMCARCPLIMHADLLHDLVEYRTSKHKSVMMAARSILQLYRIVNPELLPRKERVPSFDTVCCPSPSRAVQEQTLDRFLACPVIAN